MDEEAPPTAEELENATERHLEETHGEMTLPPHTWPKEEAHRQDVADEVPTP